jgi:16S rRNA (guanine527-N7)-methyltransferase
LAYQNATSNGYPQGGRFSQAGIISGVKEFAQNTQNLLGLKLTASQLATLELYEGQLLEWNSRFNLTAIQESDKIRTKHFLDSLTCMIAMRDAPMDKIIDVGTGAGFPGLPLKIIYPRMQLTLVESVGKKVSFLRHIVKTLDLQDVQIHQERVETIGQIPDHRQKYDWAIARAVAIMPVLVEYLMPLVKVGGAAIAMKGETAPAEVQTADHAIRVLGGHLRKLIPITLPGVADERYLVVIDKIAASPPGYPRKVGIPLRKPL